MVRVTEKARRIPLSNGAAQRQTTRRSGSLLRRAALRHHVHCRLARRGPCEGRICIVFHTASLDLQYDIVLKNAKLIQEGKSRSNMAGGASAVTLVVHSGDLVQVVARVIVRASAVRCFCVGRMCDRTYYKECSFQQMIQLLMQKKLPCILNCLSATLI